MGERGTDVAREAAAIVLLDDDFSSIVQAVRQGRRIFDNLRKAMTYLVAVHIPIAGVGFIPVLLGAPPILMPAHVVFLEFIIDPACSIAFEAEPPEPDVMRRPPRPRAQRLIGRWALALALLEGIIALAFTMAIYAMAVRAGRDPDSVRLLTFSALVLANISLIFLARAGGKRLWRHIVASNPTLWWLACAGLLAYVAVIGVPALREVFRLAPMTADDGLTLALGLVALWLALAALNVLHDNLRRRWMRRHAAGVMPRTSG